MISMETFQQKKRRLYGKQYLSLHINELNALTNIDISSEDLLSIVDTDLIVLNIKERFQPPSNKCYKAKISFSDKEKLLIFIGSLIKLKDREAYISVEHSLDCGLLKINSLRDFNVNFELKKATSELFTITLSDYSNRLLLDISEEDGEHYLEIEVYGDDWSQARIPD